jgi:hypothetical protein
VYIAWIGLFAQISARNLATLFVIPSFAIVFLIAFLNSAISASMNIRDLVISEHADESQKVQTLTPMNGSSTLVVKSYWNKDAITVGLFTKDLDPAKSGQVLGNVTNEIVFFNIAATQAGPAENGTGKTESPVIYDSWVSLLFAVQEGESAKLPELKIVEDASGQNADIKIFFEGQPHPQGKGLGVTTAMYDSQTLEIVSAEIHIYRSHELYQENILGAVLRHEIGHSLGIGHSTSMASIMYSRIVIVDDRVIGAIGECESDAVEMAYVQNKIKDISCMEASSTGN